MAHFDVPMGRTFANDTLRCQSNYLIRTADGVLYSIFIASDNDLYWIKSTDNGLTWTNHVAISGAAQVQGVAVWYDRWTTSGSGDVIHISWMDFGADKVFYRSLTTTTDTLGTSVDVFVGASISVSSSMVSITKAIGGNLYIAFDGDDGTEKGFYRSEDAGATWGARTDINEAASTDFYLLAPGFAADNQDIMAIFWDRSADEISRKVYDNSGDSWGESSIATTMVDVAPSSSNDSSQFSIAVDLANSRLLLVAWSARDTANADLRFWTITESAITEGTNVVLNSGDDQCMCAIALETDTDDIYVFYGGKSDGSETVGTSINIYYKVSTDTGATWGAETQLNTVPAANFTHLRCTPRFTDGDFGVYYSREFSANEDTCIVAVPEVAGGGFISTSMSGGMV